MVTTQLTSHTPSSKLTFLHIHLPMLLSNPQYPPSQKPKASLQLPLSSCNAPPPIHNQVSTPDPLHTNVLLNITHHKQNVFGKSRKTNSTATCTFPHNHFTTFADNTKSAWRPNIAHDLSNYNQNSCHKKHQHNTQHSTRFTSSFTRRTRRRVVLPIGASPTIFAVHHPTYNVKLGAAPAVSHVSPDLTKPNLDFIFIPPHFPSPARDNQLTTVHTPLRRF